MGGDEARVTVDGVSPKVENGHDNVIGFFLSEDWGLGHKKSNVV